MARPKGSKTKNPKPTMKQKQAVDNILGGNYGSKKKAMMAAGYSEVSSLDPKKNLAKKRGVIAYISKLDEEVKKRWGKSLDQKMVDVYVDGLEATKLFGKDAIEHPDHTARKSFTDSMMELKGWKGQPGTDKANYQQFNFFSVSEKKRGIFNNNLKRFLKDQHDL